MAISSPPPSKRWSLRLDLLPSGVGSRPKTLAESPNIVVSSLTGSFDSSGLSSESSSPQPSASQPSSTETVPTDYESWLKALFPAYTTAPLAAHHHDLWQWVWRLKRGLRIEPFVGIWSRGGAKSTSVEMACVAVGARRTRRYVLYVSGTQAQADDHVQNVGAMLESESVARYYPALGERLLGKYGASRGWRRNRLRTTAGLIVDALGLDAAARGIKLEEQRPDMIVFDDVDDTSDSQLTVQKKITAITQKILPAGSPDVVVMFVQNMVHYESVVARLSNVASEPADFLADRIVSGPIPALRKFAAEKRADGRWYITSGEPTWLGQDIATCQRQINDWGIRSFRAEAQHERTPPEGQAFPEFDPSVHVCEPFPIPESWPKWRAVDYGYAVPYACGWLTRSPSGRIYAYRETYGTRMTAADQAYQVRLASAGEKYFVSVGDPAMWASQREGQRFQSVADQYGEMGVALTPATNDRLSGKSLVHRALEWGEDAPPVLQVFNTCHNLIRTLPLLPVDPHKPEDVDTTTEDHSYDWLRYGLQAAHWLETGKRQKPQSYRVGGGRR